MAIGRRKRKRQEALWVATGDLASVPGHPFYERLERILTQHQFDAFAEEKCAAFYDPNGVGRPGLAPGVYFRLLLIGYFEGISSERGIAWRVSDSLALRSFLGFDLTARTPDHSTISKTRIRIDLATHQSVFEWALKVIAKEKLLSGKTIGVDATTLEANAALRSIVRRDTEVSYQDFLKELAMASGIEAPTRDDMARIDRKRPHKGSNEDWVHPHDPDAAITKMKDGRTHLAHKAEHAVDMETGAIVAVNLTGAEQGDTETMPWTLMNAEETLKQVAADDRARRHMHEKPVSEVVGDKGYHSNDSLASLEDDGKRTYISEPDRGRRNWKGKDPARRATYANRRRIRGARGQRLRKLRGEVLERAFAHAYETGGMRRLHLRGRENILKRLLVHVSGVNLGLVMRKLFGRGTPRGLMGVLFDLFHPLFLILGTLLNRTTRVLRLEPHGRPTTVGFLARLMRSARRGLSTGC